MRLTRRRRMTRSGMNMTPMIDIVFLLIIFFMTVTQVSEVNKEQLELAAQQGSEDQQPTVLTVNVTQDGVIRVSGETISTATLVGLVDSEKRRLGNPLLLTVVIRTDQRASSETTNEIVKVLGELDIQRVRFAVAAPQ